MFAGGRRKGRRGRKGSEEEEGAEKKEGREKGGIMEMGERRKGKKEKEMEVEREEGMDPETRLWRYGLQVFLGLFLKEGLGSACPQCPSQLCHLAVPLSSRSGLMPTVSSATALAPSLGFHWSPQFHFALCCPCLRLTPF